MNRVSLAHVSDLHLPFEPRLTLGQRLSKRQLSAWAWRRRRHALHRREILDALVADLRARCVDHIVVTGDIVNFALPEEFRRAAEWIKVLAAGMQVTVVPGNHDTLVPVPEREGLGQWSEWMRGPWPFVRRHGDVAFIGVSSALPTAPLLARGRVGSDQLRRLEEQLELERDAGRLRVVLLHHPIAEGAIGWRKALADRAAMRAVLERVGAELVLHGHARDARLDSIRGPDGPIPCLCVPSSSALPSQWDEGARWNCISLAARTDAAVTVRRWSVASQSFEEAGRFTLCLPRAVRQPEASG